MAYQRYAFKGIAGVVKDKDPTDTPDGVWTDVSNVKFFQGETTPAEGYAQVFSGNTDAPSWAISRVEGGTPFWYYSGPTKLWRTAGTTHTDVSRTVGGAYTNSDWQGTYLNGVLVANNGTDALQVLEGGATTFADSTSFPATLTARVVRSFKNYLIAMNLTDTGNDLPYAVRWSDAADPGIEPASWDITDPTVDAGQTNLADTSGTIVDGGPLRDQFIIYKTDAIYGMQFVGGAFIFNFRRLFDNNGLLAKECFTEFEGKHFVVGTDDIFLHDGVSITPIAEARMKNYFYNDIKADYVENIRVVKNPKLKQILILYANQSSVAGELNACLVWNWDNNTWSIRDIPPTSSATFGVIDPQLDPSWDSDTDSWDSSTNAWNSESFNPAATGVILSSATDSKFYELGNGSSYDGTTFDWRLEKESTDFGDTFQFKYIHSVIPIVVGSGTFTISVGSKNRIADGIAWSSPQVFTVGQDFRAYFREHGRYISFKFEGDSTSNLRFLGFEVEGELEGEK